MKILIALLMGFGVFAQEAEPPIDAGAVLQVEAYDPVTRAYSLIIVGEEAVGPDYATLRLLNKAVEELPYEQLRANPRALVGKEITLKRDLQLLSQAQMDRLAKPKTK